MALRWHVEVDRSGLKTDCWPARVSVPCPRGGQSADAFSVTRPDGGVVPAQARTLVRWPDGSPRWVQLDFQTNAAGEHVVSDAPADGSPVCPVRRQESGDRIAVSVGRLEVALAPGDSSPIASVAWDGRELTAGGEASSFIAAREDGTPCPIRARAVRNVAVEADGPHRYQLSWQTEHQDEGGSRLLDVRFRVEFLAGVEGFTLSYQFFHKLPGHDYLTLKSIGCDFRFPAMAGPGGRAVVAQCAYSEMWLRRFVRTRDEVRILLDRTQYSPYVEDAAVLQDDTEYPYFLRGGHRAVASAVALQDEAAAVVCTMRGLECQRPKTMTVSPGRVRFGIWPERAGKLSLPQGRSSRQVFCFLFCEPDRDKVDALLADPRPCSVEPAVAWLSRADSVHAGPTWDQPRLFAEDEPGAAFFSYLLKSGTGRWRTVAEMFHYGDTVDAGYSTNYAAGGRAPKTERVPGEHIFAAGGGSHGHFHTPDHVAPVWSNNEYDAIYCLALEALRTSSAEALAKLRAAARHQIEVDFVHYSDHWQHHRSTPPHSYDHVTAAASLPSHQWTQGLYYYYALTGDDDVPEVVRAICEFDLMYLGREELASVHYFNRELGWATLALVFGYELTAEKRYIEAARDIIRELQACAGRTDFDDYEKLHPTGRGLNAAGLGLGFAANTVPLGLKAYHQATQQDWARQLLIEWVDFGMAQHNDRSTGVKFTELFPESFCYVCELTGKTRHLDESLWQLVMFLRGFNSLGWLSEGGGPLTTKQYARVYRGLCHYVSALSRAGILERAERLILKTAPDGTPPLPF